MPERLTGIAVSRGPRPPWGNTSPSAEFDAPVRAVPVVALPQGARKVVDSSELRRSAAAMEGRSELRVADLSFLAALALAFVGGLVLNLMPCVLPVLSIKLLSLAQHKPDRAALRTHALAYSAGVVVSFLALAAALLGLRSAGSAIGWGFQLQEPGFVFTLALIFFVLG